MATLTQVQLLNMAHEVLQVCADHKVQDIIEDLTITGSSEATINRIFDGQFLKKLTPELDLPNPSDLFRSASPELPQLAYSRSLTAASRNQTTPTSASKPLLLAKAPGNVVVILSSDEEDSGNAGKLNGADDTSDIDDGFEQLMKNINLIKKGQAGTSKSTNRASFSGSNAAKATPLLPLSPRKRTALSPPLFLDQLTSLSVERTPRSPSKLAKSLSKEATTSSLTAAPTNGLNSRSADTTPTKTRTGGLATEFTDKMPLSYEICSDWDDPPFLPESPSPPSKPKTPTSRTPTATRNSSETAGFKAWSPSPSPPLSPTKREWALSRSPSPGFMARLSNNESPHIGTSTPFTSTSKPTRLSSISKFRQPSPSTIVRHRSSTQDKKSGSPLPTEADLLAKTREFNATSPVNRYSDASWLRTVKAEKQTDRARQDQLEREPFLIKDDSDDDNIFGIKKEEFKSSIGRTTTAHPADLFDDDDNDDYTVKKKEDLKRSISRTATTRVTDAFDDGGTNEWSKYDDLIDDTLSPPRTLQDDDDDYDPLRALDADGDVWSKNKKRSRNNAGLPQSPASKDSKKSRLPPMSPTKRRTKSGARASSSSLAIPGIEHFDLTMLNEYRDDPIVLDDGVTASASVEQELEKRSRAARQLRQGKGRAKNDSDLEFDNNESGGECESDTKAPKRRAAKGKDKEALKARREMEKAVKDAEKAERDAEKVAVKALRDLQKEIEKSEREAKAAEKLASTLARRQDLEKKKKEREDERQAKADAAEVAKQEERKFRISNRLTSKSESVKEIILCIEESMFDSEVGKALETYLQPIECRIDFLKSPVTGAIAAANAAATNTSRRDRASTAISESTSLSELSGTNDACPVHDMIFWRRIVTTRMDDNGDKFPLPEDEHTIELESNWLCYMTAKDFCKKIEQNELQWFLDSVTRDMRIRLSRQKTMQEAMGLTPTTNEDWTRRQRVILMIEGLGKHLHGLKKLTAQDFQARVLARIAAEQGGSGGGSNKAAKATPGKESGPDEERVGEILMDLQLEQDCLIMLTDDVEDSAQQIVSVTEQLSQRPYKTGIKTGLNVCVDGIKSGVGYDDTWAKSLEQIHMLTPNIAEGIVAVYPTVRSLYEGYRRCRSVYEAMYMLENVELLGSNRIIGKTMSKKVYDVFMGEDPDAGISSIL
ncbi:hypothetical protein EC991_002100 [Linnemannia zychae]|nr:hypothetical protein EC991_002100 [Linnemannia zychae]